MLSHDVPTLYNWILNSTISSTFVNERIHVIDLRLIG